MYRILLKFYVYQITRFYQRIEIYDLCQSYDYTRTPRIFTIKSIYKISWKVLDLESCTKFIESRKGEGQNVILQFLSSNIMHNSIIDFYQCAPCCAIEKGLRTKSTLYMSRQRDSRYIEKIYNKVVIDKMFATSRKGDTRFLTERRFTQWCRNLNYKRNIIEDERDNKNILLL